MSCKPLVHSRLLGLGLNERDELKVRRDKVECSGAEGSGCCAVVVSRCKAKWQRVER
jgi:hypothetical protein